MAQTNQQAKKQMRNLTREEKSERARIAAQKEQAEKARRERADLRKKVLTVIVCIILVLALGIPTMALTVLSQS